jgi:hypothetical protein
MPSPLTSGFMKTGNKNPRNVGLAPRPDERWAHAVTDGLWLIKVIGRTFCALFPNLNAAPPPKK